MVWVPLRHVLFPPVPPPPPPLKLPHEQLWAGLPVEFMVIAPAGVPGIGPALPQVTQLALADWSAGNREAWFSAWLANKDKPVEKPPKPAPAVAEKPKKPDGQKPPKNYVLGDSDEFNIQVTITTLGGGIKELILNKFDEADRLGRPVRDPNGQREKLHLIPEGEHADDPAAFLLYHFGRPGPKPDDKNNPPLDTLGKLVWEEVAYSNQGEKHELVLKAVPEPEVIVNGQPRKISITKTYTLGSGDYHIGLELKFELQGDAKDGPIDFGYQVAGPLRMPIEGVWYTNVFRNAIIGGFDSSGKNVWRDLQDNRSIGVQGGGRDLVRDETDQKFIRFAGVATQFFASMVVVSDQQENSQERTFVRWARPTLESASPNPNQQFLDDITTRVNAEIKQLKPGVPVTHKYLLYNGPAKVRLLGQLAGEKEVSPELIDRYENTLHLNQLTDYGRFGFWTDLIVFFTNVMHRLLWILNHVLPRWLCILTLTLLVRGSMFPLSRKQALQSAKMQAKMRELAPEFKQLEEKYKNDPMGLQHAKHELMMKRGINPMAMLGSCWIVLAQMPIFLGLYYALQESILFRLAPFLWIRNLAAPDMLIWWGENIPWISRPQDQGSSWLFLGPFFNIFPIIWVVLQIMQQKMMMLPPTNEQEAMQQKMMKYMMVVIGVMFYKVAAGLCLYFIMSALWSLAERKLLPKSQLAPAGTAKGGSAGPAMGGGGTAPPRPKSPLRPRPRPKPTNGDGVIQRVKDWWERVLEEAKKK
jgi:YidC/Oxa1 family membrane protein insertase